VFMERFGAGGEYGEVTNVPQTPVRSEDGAPELVPIFEMPEVVRDAGVASSAAPSDHATGTARSLSNRGRIHRAVAFLRYILSEYSIEAASDIRVEYRIQRLERTIERLWQSLEDRTQQRAVAAGQGHH
jgi:hypothetical protein